MLGRGYIVNRFMWLGVIRSCCPCVCVFDITHHFNPTIQCISISTNNNTLTIHSLLHIVAFLNDNRLTVHHEGYLTLHDEQRCERFKKQCSVHDWRKLSAGHRVVSFAISSYGRLWRVGPKAKLSQGWVAWLQFALQCGKMPDFWPRATNVPQGGTCSLLYNMYICICI